MIRDVKPKNAPERELEEQGIGFSAFNRALEMLHASRGVVLLDAELKLLGISEWARRALAFDGDCEDMRSVLTDSGLAELMLLGMTRGDAVLTEVYCHFGVCSALAVRLQNGGVRLFLLPEMLIVRGSVLGNGDYTTPPSAGSAC